MLKIKEKLFEFEKNPELLEFKFEFDNILMWPFVRYVIFQGVIAKELQLQAQSSNFSDKETSSKKEKIITFFAPFILNPFFRRKEYSILVLNWTSNIEGIKEGKRYFNKRDDYFGGIFPKETLFLEQTLKGKFRYPRVHGNVLSRDCIDIMGKIVRRIIKPTDIDKKRIHDHIEFIKTHFPYKIDPEKLTDIKSILLSNSVKLKTKKILYKSLLKSIKPKLVFVQNSTYGPTGYLVKWIKEFGIKTAELQHGTITKGHIGYNFNDDLINNTEYQKYIPDYLLTFGEFWNLQTNTCSKKITIGNPHFSKIMKGFARKEKSLNSYRVITVISQWTIAKQLIRFTIELSKLLENSNIKIIFRLHPTENEHDSKYQVIKMQSNIKISSSGDVYSLFNESDYIVGCYSTVLYEAAAFGNPIFIYNNELSKMWIPKELGIWIKNAQELVNNLNIKTNINEFSYYWNPNWEKNYRKFIKNEIGIA